RTVGSKPLRQIGIRRAEPQGKARCRRAGQRVDLEGREAGGGRESAGAEPPKRKQVDEEIRRAAVARKDAGAARAAAPCVEGEATRTVRTHRIAIPVTARQRLAQWPEREIDKHCVIP